MAKFETQIDDIKNRLQNARKVLVVMPTQANVDKLASGLALYLSLKAAGKTASIASEVVPLVSHANLFGVGDIKNVLALGSGNFLIHLDGVVDEKATDPTKKVPTLSNLDWYPSGQTLNLVFHVVPGQRFEPTKVSSSFENSGFDLIFIIGAASVAELGSLYIQNATVFSQAQMINIDLNPANTNFGAVNIIGVTSATISEIVSEVITGLRLPMDSDIASNILTGIYDATSNLSGIVGSETFLAAGIAMQSGGNIPVGQSVGVLVSQPSSQVVSQNVPMDQNAGVSEPVLNPISQNPFLSQVDQSSFTINTTGSISNASTSGTPNIQSNPGLDLRQVLQIPEQPADIQAQPSTTQSKPDSASPASNAASAEERPVGEYASSTSLEMDSQPTPDWLVPKIFKSGNLG